MLRGAAEKQGREIEAAEKDDVSGSERERESNSCRDTGENGCKGEVAKGANNRGWTNKPIDPKPRRDADCLKIKSASKLLPSSAT